MLWRDFQRPLNERDAVGEWARRDVDEPEAKVAVGPLMDSLERERVSEAKTAWRRWPGRPSLGS